MADGGHILLGQEGISIPTAGSPGMHWEEGVGWGTFPVPLPKRYGYYYDPHPDGLHHIWLGCDNKDSAGFPPFESFVYEWNGVSWLTHTFSGGGIVFKGAMAISRAPGTNIIYAAYNGDNGGASKLFKYDGVSTWSTIRAWGAYTGYGGAYGWFTPLALDSTTCVWISSSPRSGLSAYWINATTRYSGGDLPVVDLRGITQLGGDIFILTVAGDVYRGSSPTGPFVLDNPTLGPFAGNFIETAKVTNYMATSADGQTIVIQGNNDNYWVRDGADNWTNYQTGLAGTISGIPCAVDRQTLFRAAYSGGRCHISFNGGTTWSYADSSIVSVNGRASCALIDTVSNERRMLTIQKDSLSGHPALWWRGDAPHSPWASWKEYKATPLGMKERLSIQGFESGHVVISGLRTLSGERSAIHYIPTLDAWSQHYVVSEYSEMYVFGTEYASGKLHGVVNRFQDNILTYCRWNGSSYDTSSIPGSTRVQYQRYHIQADDTGQDVWVTGETQVWHSDDGGTSWTNRYAAAAAVHSDAADAVDVVVVSATEVYVSFISSGSGTRFSLWNGSVWSLAAPDLAARPGERSIYVDNNGALWFYESSTSGTSETYKLVTGSWVLQDTYTYDNGTRNVTGIASFGDEAMMSLSLHRPNQTTSYTQGALYDKSDSDSLGWHPWRAYSPTSIFTDASYWQNFEDVPPTIDSNSPTGVTPDNTPTISFSTKDIGGSGVDPLTIQCTVNEADAIVDGVIQSGWSGTIVANAFDGYDVSITPDVEIELFTDVDVSADCDDADGNSATTFEWTFTIEGIELVLVEAINEYTIRAHFNIPMSRSDPTSIASATNPVVYSLSGGYRDLSVLSVSTVDSSTFDLTVLEMTDLAAYELVVASSVENESGALTLGDSL